MPRLLEPKYSYTFDYPEAIQFAKVQSSIFWTDDEINVEKDIQDIRVNMTEAEAHGVITTLRLFTLYELVAGRDYWLGRVLKTFPRPDIERMAATFGFFELNVHAPFYNKINEALMLNTDEFYLAYVNDPILKERMEFVDSLVEKDDPLYSLGAFSMVEGAVLYSSFAFLKHFQAKGKNKLMNVVRGINFSVRDENLHCEGGAWLFNTLKQEIKAEGGYINPNLEYDLANCARTIAEHEFRIVDMIFEKGEMEGITAEQMKTFVKSRVNICLAQLGIDPVFDVSNNIIAEWFYDGINGVMFHDFFSGIGNSYNRSWDEKGFSW
ncbi:ribonucleotide-diphosphate reductase subunit beta [Pseudomonas phage PP21]